MFVGCIFIFEGIDFDNISRLWNITDGFNFPIDDSVFERQSDVTMYSKRKIQNST
jgi:hypothetical protein